MTTPGSCGGWREGLPLVPDDEVKEVLGEVSPAGLQGAAQLLTAMAEGAGEVEVFIATKEGGRSGHSALKPPLSHLNYANTISLGKTPLALWGL